MLLKKWFVKKQFSGHLAVVNWLSAMPVIMYGVAFVVAVAVWRTQPDDGALLAVLDGWLTVLIPLTSAVIHHYLWLTHSVREVGD